MDETKLPRIIITLRESRFDQYEPHSVSITTENMVDLRQAQKISRMGLYNLMDKFCNGFSIADKEGNPLK